MEHLSEPLSRREVASSRLSWNKWRELTIDTGAAQSTLQDFKVPDAAGGYAYNDTNAWLSPTCNRSIFWKTYNDTLELCEISMDANLIGNQLKLRFQNTPVLEGVSVHETPEQVVILLATVASVHRLTFPHPFSRSNNVSLIGSRVKPLGSEPTTTASIFYNFSAEDLRDANSYHVLNNSYNVGGSSFVSSGLPFPIASCSWLTSEREAVYVLANSLGSLLVVKLGSPQTGKMASWELKQTTLMDKIKGFVPSIIRGNQEGEEAVVSLVSHITSKGDDYLVFALCRDLRIRMWSYSLHECLLVHSVLPLNQAKHANAGSNGGAVHSSATVRRPILRKAVSGATLHLAAFVSSVDQKQFLVYRLARDNGNYALRAVATLQGRDEDLVDFGLTSKKVWSLWLNSQSEMNLLYSSIERDTCSMDWQRVSLHSEFLPTVNVKSMFVGAKELYIDDIFFRGKFSLQTIVKAISIFSRIPETSFIGGKTNLMEEVAKIVENRIKSQVVSSEELPAEELTNLEVECWDKFYSYCMQYRNVGNKPLGLLIDTRTGLVGVLKKATVSFVVPNDTTDHMILCSPSALPSYINMLSDDLSIESSLLWVLKGVQIISRCLSEEAALEFEVGLENGEVVETIASKIADNYLVTAIDVTSGRGEPLKRSFDNVFAKSPQLIEAMDLILRGLDLEPKEAASGTFPSATHPIVSQLLTSEIGVSVLSDSIKQMSRMRFTFCRDLLLLQTFLLQLRNKSGFTSEKIEKMRSQILPTTGVYLQAYYFMIWVCEAQILDWESNGRICSEISEAQLTLLELTEYINVNRADSAQSSTWKDQAPNTLIAYFIQRRAGALARNVLSLKVEEMINEEIWNSSLPLLVTSIAQLIWPISTTLHLPEFLLGYGQYKLILDYVRLLDNWCQWNTFSRQFLRGFVNLVLKEPNNAVVCFNETLLGINDEPFLRKIIKVASTGADENEAESEPCSLSSHTVFAYYSKIIQLFKQHSYHEAIIQLASQAVLLLDQASDPNYTEHVACLYTTLFMFHLELENISEAYQVMILNPDPVQRKDCLRQFIVKLCEKQLLEELVTFSYNDVSDEFVNIIESRARSSDLLPLYKGSSNYYEILYSYYVKDSNYRNAAAIIFEFGRRLSQEVPGVDSLRKQASCFLLALNCLKIVNPKYSWIIKPSLKASARQSLYSMVSKPVENNLGPKRNYEGDSFQEQEEGKGKAGLERAAIREIQVIGTEDIKIEYELTNARLKLLLKDPEMNAVAGTLLSPAEIVTLLVANSMFDLALHLSSWMKLPLKPVFEGLASKYANIVQVPIEGNEMNETLTQIYDCFVENDTVSLCFIGNAELTPVDKMWHLIFLYVDLYEEANQSTLHQCVAEKLLECGIMLPASLKLSYQKRNCPQLLRLLMCYGFDEEAVSLGIEYTDAFLGKGAEYFDMKVPIFPNSPPVYFPYNHMNNLVLMLKEGQKENASLVEAEKRLEAKLKQYKEFTLKTSQMTLSLR